MSIERRYPLLKHVHDALDVTSGVFSPDRLGTGTRTGSKFLRDDGTWQTVAGGGGGGSWGSITGTLTDQTDLVAALAAKADLAHTHSGADITSGRVLPDYLGTGVRDGTKFLRDDGAWAIPGADTVKLTRGATFVGSPVTIDVNAAAVVVPQNMTISRVTILTTGGTGTCTVDIRKKAYASYPPTGADSICGGSKPNLSGGATKYQDAVLSGWTLPVSTGDVLLFVLEAATGNFTSITVVLEFDTGIGVMGTGEVNTASNLGAGEGIWASKVGVDLRFKSLVAGSNVTLSSDANTVTINASTGTSAVQTRAKLSDTSRSNTNTPAIDSEISAFSLDANSVYEVEYALFFNNTTTNSQGIQWKFVYSGTWNARMVHAQTLTGGLQGAAFVQSSFSGTTIMDTQITNPSIGSAADVYVARALIRTTTSGSLEFRWAQNFLSANNTTLLAGTYVKVTKVN